MFQVTLLSSLMDSMPSIGYHTWMVGWTVDMMFLTAIMLMECIVAAYAKHAIQVARDALSKKDDDSRISSAEYGEVGGTSHLADLSGTKLGRRLSIPFNDADDERKTLRIQTWLLVLGELDTIARMVFPGVFVGNIILKELRLVEPRDEWSGLVIAYFVFYVCLCLGMLGLSVKKILDNIGLLRKNAGKQPQEETQNPTVALSSDAGSQSSEPITSSTDDT